MVVCLVRSGAAAEIRIGERPAVENHLDQSRIDAGEVGFRALVEHGRLLFSVRFNILDGIGRPGSTGAGEPRTPDQPLFIRTSSPESTSCGSCHNQPRTGGAGDFVTNAFVLAHALDPVTDSVSSEFSDERNPPGLMGAGPIEMLAREMSAELIAIREGARNEASSSGFPVVRPLSAKGVRFGSITVMPDGRVDPSGIDGVDWDLIIKPFHQKGAVVSIRQFANNATNHHHGMQSMERFGPGVDADLDGIIDELTVGDMTALTIFIASLNTPGRKLLPDPQHRAAVRQGERLFGEIGCASCHLPALELDDPRFIEPSPFNPPGNLGPEDLPGPISFDMTRQGSKPRLERTRDGGAIVRAFTDLKRHTLSDADYNHFANEQLPQGQMTGFAPSSEFTRDAEPRPTWEFLTKRLWDVGNTGPYGHRGDLTTITEAIHQHGGQARATRDAFFGLPQADRDTVIEFLKSLQILPDGSTGTVMEGHGRN